MSAARPGVALKSLRKRNRWTLVDVSKRTGIPPSTLSRIENDQISPTYDLLLRLSSGLSIDLTQLLAEGSVRTGSVSEQPGRRSVNRPDSGEIVSMSNHTLRYLSTDLINKQFTPILSEYRARSLEEFGDFMHHPGEEFLYVIDGELELHTECYSPLVLKAGESVYFDSRMGHAYVARGEKPCHALSISTVPQFFEPPSQPRVKATDEVAASQAPAALASSRRAATRTKRKKRRAG